MNREREVGARASPWYEMCLDKSMWEPTNPGRSRCCSWGETFPKPRFLIPSFFRHDPCVSSFPNGNGKERAGCLAC